MDDVSISGTLQGMYNGLATQQDAYGRARFYNSLASTNQNNLSEQMLEQQKQRDFGNLLQSNMSSTPTAQPQQGTQAPQPQAPSPVAPQASGLSQMGQPYPMATTAPTAALDRQAMLQANQQRQQAPDQRQQMIQAYQQAQGSTPTLTPLADHPAVQGALQSTPNTHPNTALATDPDNPTFSSQHTFVSTDPQTGQPTTKNTFNRQGLIDQMMNYTDRNGNHSMAADANKLMAQFTASDAADEKIKQDGIMVANGKALQLSAGLEYMSPADQAAVFGNLKSRATQMGADTSGWPTGPDDPNFKPWVQQQGEEARMNANTAKEASKRAEDAFNAQKADAEAGKDTAQGLEAQAKSETDKAQAGLYGQQAQTQPSVRNKNNAEAFKAYQEGLKAQKEPANGGQTDETANVPPKLVAPATADFAKSTQKYAQSTAAQQGLSDFIDAARSGNVIASAYTPTEAVLAINTASGVKRVNMSEISSMSSAGSLVQRIQGKLAGLATGDKVPDSVLADLAQVRDNMGATSTAQHQNEVNGINATYHSDFKPMVNKGGILTKPGQNLTPIGTVVRMPDGSTRTKTAKGWN